MDDLRKENARLRRELEVCRQECDRLRALQPARRGLEGQRYIAQLVDGHITTPTNARADVMTKDGRRLEIKLSSLRDAMPGVTKTKQWVWRNLLGEDGKKKYDCLILLGRVDQQFGQERDRRYVIFDIPYSDVLCVIPNPRCLAVTMNPRSGWSKTSGILYQNYLTSEAKVREKYTRPNQALEPTASRSDV